MKIAVVGSGYVGLVTGTCFAEMGNQVVCVDIDQAKIDKMKKGQIPIYEPDLEDLFKRNIDEHRLSFTTSLAEGIKDAEIIFLALPTPPGADGSADLSYILQVADKLGDLLKSYAIIVNKSTVPVGTSKLVRQRIAEKSKVDFDVVSNPEFLREGFAVGDFMKPDRVVVGTSSAKARKIMARLYQPFVSEGNPLYFMDEASAEMTKYAANSFLAMKISFMNEIANLSELTGADVDSIRLAIGADDRIGKRFLFAGIGYGGSCFPKDVQAFYKTSKDYGHEFQLLESVMRTNDQQKKVLVQKLLRHFKNNVAGKTFALWGLAFKPDTDDMREAPAIEIINLLIENGARVRAFDPQARETAQEIYKDRKEVVLVDEQYKALEGAEALLIATEWPEFRSPDFSKIKELLKSPMIFDGRNLYESEDLKKLNFHYESIGRAVVDGR